MNIKCDIRASINRLFDLVYPRDCMISGEPVQDNSEWHYFNHVSLQELGIVKPPHCPTCGFPFFADGMLNRMCPHCQQLDPLFNYGRTCLLMQGPGRKLIHELKYKQGWYLLHDIENIFKATPGFTEYISNCILVPVPLHRRKFKKRGFNQTELLADSMQKVGQNTSVVPMLDRVKNTRSQTRLDLQKRQKNVAQAFALKPGLKPDPAKRYVVVDDVFTTGSTLNACCELLRDAGATQIDIATLGHG